MIQEIELATTSSSLPVIATSVTLNEEEEFVMVFTGKVYDRTNLNRDPYRQISIKDLTIGGIKIYEFRDESENSILNVMRGVKSPFVGDAYEYDSHEYYYKIIVSIKDVHDPIAMSVIQRCRRVF